MADKQLENKIPAYYKQNAFFPWQSGVWKQLYSNNINTGHFPHALLVSGIAGIGKKELAFYLARGLLCRSFHKNDSTGEIQPCDLDADNVCRSCKLFSAGTHPDLYHITTPPDKKVIPVDDIRSLIQWSVLSSQLDGKKIIIIEPAEAMNINAANSLLKTLEEPVANTIIILLSSQKQALLATIRSRCRSIDMALPDIQKSIQWLAEQNVAQAELMLSLASGAPLRAEHLSHSTELQVRQFIIDQLLAVMAGSADPLSVAETFFKQTKVKISKTKRGGANKDIKKCLITADTIIYWFDSLVSDLVRIEHKCAQSTISNIDYYHNLQQLSDRLYLNKLLQLSDSINKAYSDIKGQLNLNLLFEKLLIDWNDCQK